MTTFISSQTPPAYPAFARQARITGDVVLGIVVAADGKVKSVRVLSGNQVLAESAANAVRNWRYKPYLLHGQPVEVDTTVTVRFTGPGN